MLNPNPNYIRTYFCYVQLAFLSSINAQGPEFRDLWITLQKWLHARTFHVYWKAIISDSQFNLSCNGLVLTEVTFLRILTSYKIDKTFFFEDEKEPNPFQNGQNVQKNQEASPPGTQEATIIFSFETTRKYQLQAYNYWRPQEIHIINYNVRFFR